MQSVWDWPGLWCCINGDWTPRFASIGLLTRDARIKERKKPGLKRARKAPTYTKR